MTATTKRRVIILDVETGDWLPGSGYIKGEEGARLAASLLPGMPPQVIEDAYSRWMTDDYPAGASPDGAKAVLSFFGDPVGVTPGSFVQSLLETMSHADETNRARLVAAFPEYGRPFLMAKSARDGIERLRAIVEGARS